MTRRAAWIEQDAEKFDVLRTSLRWTAVAGLIVRAAKAGNREDRGITTRLLGVIRGRQQDGRRDRNIAAKKVRQQLRANGEFLSRRGFIKLLRRHKLVDDQLGPRLVVA